MILSRLPAAVVPISLIRGTSTHVLTLLRHDLILKLLAKLFRSIGAIVRIEPRVYIGEERKIPDLDILLPDRAFFVDVAITHPNSPSRESATPLAAAKKMEAHKAWKYRRISEAPG